MSRDLKVRLNAQTCRQMIANLSDSYPPIAGTTDGILLQQLTALLPQLEANPALEGTITFRFSDHRTGEAS